MSAVYTYCNVLLLEWHTTRIYGASKFPICLCLTWTSPILSTTKINMCNLARLLVNQTFCVPCLFWICCLNRDDQWLVSNLADLCSEHWTFCRLQPETVFVSGHILRWFIWFTVNQVNIESLDGISGRHPFKPSKCFSNLVKVNIIWGFLRVVVSCWMIW